VIAASSVLTGLANVPELLSLPLADTYILCCGAKNKKTGTVIITSKIILT